MNEKVKRDIYYKVEPKLSEITQFDIEDLYKWLYDCGLKGSSVDKYHILFGLVFDRAVRKKVFTLETNPMREVKKSTIKPYIADFYSSKKLKSLFVIVKDDVLEIPITLAGHYRLRRSEVLGIKWDAIDFDNNCVVIRHTVTKVSGSGENLKISSKNLTKTTSGYRTMSLKADLRKALIIHRLKIEKNKRFLGNTYITQTMDYVCVKENGELIKPNHFTQRYIKIVRRNPIKEVRLHDLRHSVGS